MRAKSIFVDAFVVFLIILWVYAATSKLLDYNNFNIELGKSPLLSPVASLVAVGVPILELGLAFMLLIERTKFIALILSTSLLLLFAVYLLIILHYSSYIPCSCGGILGKLGYKEHIVFNLVLFVLGLVAIFWYGRSTRPHNGIKYDNPYPNGIEYPDLFPTKTKK